MARTKAQNVAEPAEPKDVTGGLLNGVTTDQPTPPGDAKEQARQARKAAYEAKKAELAAKAAASGNAPKADAPKAAPAEQPKDEPKGEEPAPTAPLPKLTTADKLRELLAVSDGRTDHKAAKEQLRSGIQAILDDMPKATQPKATRPKDDASKAKANSEIEERMLATMREKGAVKDGTPITLQDVMRAMGFDMKDAKPYNAMVRMRNDGRVQVVVDKAPRQFVVA